MYIICNNLDDVLMNMSSIMECDSFEFQGDECEVTEIPLDYIEHAFAYNGKIVFVHMSAEGRFDVTMSEYYDFNRQYRCILLPDYCKDEFIHLLKTK
jgi:hypothetical protein